MNVGIGQVAADCHRRRGGEEFLTFLKKAVQPRAGKQIHVALDNLSTHTTPEVKRWAGPPPGCHLQLHAGRVQLDERGRDLAGIITRQAIRRSTFSSVNALVARIRNDVEHWNTDAKPFHWTATTEGILPRSAWLRTAPCQIGNKRARAHRA